MRKTKKTIGGFLAQVPTWTTTGDQPTQIKDLEVVFAKTVRVATVLAGVAVLVMLVAAGFQYLTAGEDPKAMEKASKSLTSAFVGLVVVISAWLILQAIQVITGLNVTVFKVGE